jgi:hypothetical protein
MESPAASATLLSHLLCLSLRYVVYVCVFVCARARDCDEAQGLKQIDPVYALPVEVLRRLGLPVWNG